MGITTRVDLSTAQLTELTDLIACYLPHVPVWAFGSRVKGTARPHSDLDLVIFSAPDQEPALSALREALEESNLPFRVDLLVWDAIPASFKANIEQNYAVIHAGDHRHERMSSRSDNDKAHHADRGT